MASLTEKIIKRHLCEGKLEPGEPIAIIIDQTLTQDATGTMAYLQLEAMGVDQVQTGHPAVFKRLGHLERMLVVDLLPGIIALRQSHATPPDNIYGRNQLNHKDRKFSRMRTPTAPLFST